MADDDLASPSCSSLSLSPSVRLSLSLSLSLPLSPHRATEYISGEYNYLRMQFEINGTMGKGTVYLEMKKPVCFHVPCVFTSNPALAPSLSLFVCIGTWFGFPMCFHLSSFSLFFGTCRHRWLAAPSTATGTATCLLTSKVSTGSLMHTCWETEERGRGRP